MVNGFLKGKTAVVTGAARNLGRSFAEMLGSHGASVVVHYKGEKSRTEAEETASLVRNAGGTAELISADLTNSGQLRKVFARALERFGRLDVLVNNAAIIIKKLFADISEAEYDHIFAINAKAPFLCMQEAARLMSDYGRIINIGTGILGMSIPAYSVYAGSKAPLEHFTRTLAKEATARGITVNTIAPGSLNTPFFYGGETPESVAMIKQMTGGLGEVSDIVPIVEFLASPGAQWVTGQTIFVNGGLLTR
jgi:NAD(P)-dependent dehydrogenase (short-subunit alcohol dehydrogenase family)